MLRPDLDIHHHRIWRALDRLAEIRGLSTSGLAKASGLDPTAFNESKRCGRDGRPRWPGGETLAKVMAATGADLAELTRLSEDGDPPPPPRACIPLIGMAQAGDRGFFDDGGFPVGGSWDEVEFPHVADENTYALEITGESMLPAFRDGDVLIVSPNSAPRRGDRIVAKTREGEVMAKELARITAKTVTLRSFNPEFEDRTLNRTDLIWMARIIWVSQ